MINKRKISIFTGNRAEYGLLYPIIRAIADDDNFEYYLLVSGAHLQEDFGYTASEIVKDGLEVFGEVKMTMDQDSLLGTTQAIGSGVLAISQWLGNIRPDLHLVYADRFEGFAAMIAGTQMGIPTAHIEGGDLTEGGALDDSVRHAMTKLAHLHFATNAQAVERIIKLGEEPWRVHNVGYSTLDLIASGHFAKPEELARQYQIDTDKPMILFTQHSVSTEFTEAEAQLMPTLTALRALAKDGVQVMMTYPNNDAGGKKIIGALELLKAENLPNIFLTPSLGRYNYSGFLNLCGNFGPGLCLGNSSSGLKETPYFACPVVNIGSRQDGRLRSTNVIDTGYDTQQILAACRKALFSAEFRDHCRHCENPYGKGNTGPMIAKILADVSLDKKLIQKKMTY